MQSVGIAFPWELRFLTNHLVLLVGDYNTQVAKKKATFYYRVSNLIKGMWNKPAPQNM